VRPGLGQGSSFLGFLVPILVIAIIVVLFLKVFTGKRPRTCAFYLVALHGSAGLVPVNIVRQIRIENEQ
jgi:hypothetical protein